MFGKNKLVQMMDFIDATKSGSREGSLFFKGPRWMFTRWGGLSFIAFYFLLALAFFKFASIHGSISPVWPPAGLASLAFVLCGRRSFAWVFLAASLSNFYMSQHLPSSLGIALGNALESLVCGVLIHWIFKRAKNFPELRFPLAIFWGGLAASLVGASIGIFSLKLAGFLPQDKLAEAWLTWWIGDWLGIILVLPFIYFFHKKERIKLLHIWKNKTVQSIGTTLILVFVFGLAYQGLKPIESMKFLFVLFYILLIPTFLKSRLMAVLNGTTLAILILFVTLSGFGPFNLSQLNQNILHLDIFLLALLLTNAVIISFFNSDHFKTFQVLMMLGWFFCGTIFYSTQNNILQDNRDQISDSLKDLSDEIRSEFARHVGILTGGAALFRASNEVDAVEWKAYIEHITKFYNIPSVRGTGVVFKVSEVETPDFEKKYRKTMDSEFRIKSLNPGESYQGNHFVITFIEPIDKNRPARGLDLASEKLRREAAVKAIQTGEPQVTDTIQLVQDNIKRPGFLIYLPVYKKDLDISTPEAREKNFSHFIYSPVNTFDFFGAIASKTNHQFHVEIFDRVSAENLSNSKLEGSEGAKKTSGFSGLPVYADENIKINKNYPAVFQELILGGKSFLIKFNVTEKYLAHLDFISSWISLLGGLVVLLISIFIVNTLSLKDRASEMAQKLFDEYSKSLLKIQQQETKMSEAAKMASLGEMASGVAHEINNPLAIISSTATLLERRIQKFAQTEKKTEHEKELIDFTSRIRLMVDRISRIVKGLQQFARDGTHDAKQPVVLDKIIQDTIVFCQERFKNGGVELRLELNYRGPIYCREVQISQVLLNLLNNAYDAIQSLDSKWIEINTAQKRGWVELSVKDSGSGIPEEIREKILQPFFTTKEVGKGTGLGLSLSKGIIESHGGQLSLDGQSSHTTFVVRLPIQEVQSKAA